MAYFPNGTAGEVLDEQCHQCLHAMNDGVLCPVYYVQMEYNYKQCDDGQECLRAAMNLLVNEAGECQMRRVMFTAGVDFSAVEQLGLFNEEGG